MDLSNVQYKKPIDEQLVNKLIDYLRQFFKHLPKMGLSKIMVGVFEANSIIAATLLKQTLNENVVAMIFDFGTDYTNTLVSTCNKLSLNSYILKRGIAYQEEMAVYGKSPQHYKRFMNYHLLIQADQMKAVLIDTIDKSDRLLGTRPEGFYGHFMPFYSLYKSELQGLASYLQVPDNLESYQGLTYDKLDPVLFLLTEKLLSPEDISQQFNIDLLWLKKLKSHIDKQPLKTTISQLII